MGSGQCQLKASTTSFEHPDPQAKALVLVSHSLSSFAEARRPISTSTVRDSGWTKVVPTPANKATMRSGEHPTESGPPESTKGQSRQGR